MWLLVVVYALMLVVVLWDLIRQRRDSALARMWFNLLDFLGFVPVAQRRASFREAQRRRSLAEIKGNIYLDGLDANFDDLKRQTDDAILRIQAELNRIEWERLPSTGQQRRAPILEESPRRATGGIQVTITNPQPFPGGRTPREAALELESRLARARRVPRR